VETGDEGSNRLEKGRRHDVVGTTIPRNIEVLMYECLVPKINRYPD
jgi:hypothetical protein